MNFYIHKILCKIKILKEKIETIEEECCNGGGGGGENGILSVEPGNGISIDNTSPKHPIVNALEVSNSQKGIVNNTELQELGGKGKVIDGIYIGQGNKKSQHNVGFGYSDGGYPLFSVTTGTNNTALGLSAVKSLTSGRFNVGVGDYALYSITTGQWNTGVGSAVMNELTTGSDNTAINSGLFHLKTGSGNTGIGHNAGYALESGSYNTLLGRSAGYDGGTGSYNVMVGYLAGNVVGGGYNNGGSTINTNRNVIIGPNIKIADLVNDVLAIDNKGATNTNHQNALLYGNFSTRFLRVNGRLEIDSVTMPAADANYTKKLVWNPSNGYVGVADDLNNLENITGFDPGKTQVLMHVNGAFQWVDAGVQPQ